jgi:hypothetical protein
MKPLDLNNYQKQGNLAIDMIAACIIHTRKQGIEPKAIVLAPAYYGLLQQWVADKYDHETAEAQFFLDTVEIRRETFISGKILHVEFWPKPIAEA